MAEKIIILTEGATDPLHGKTASCVIRYRPDDVIALLDRELIGKTSGELLGVGGDLPVVGSIDDAPGATTLLLGTAPPGGKIPPAWRAIILDAIERGLDVVSGLHEFLNVDEEFAAAAQRRGVRLTDVRMTDEKEIAKCTDLRRDCLRVLTVGHDCSVGKMLTAVELTKGLKHRGLTAKFIATGQTGIMVEGDGCPIDHVISDFVSGAVERMILAQQHHDVLLIEGQGSLAHPSYSAVTMGLIHGSSPQAMILCYQPDREQVIGLEHLRVPPLAKIKALNEAVASVHHPARVIGISMNSSNLDAQQADAERKRIQDEFQLPVCDVIRHGPDDLLNAIVATRAGSDWQTVPGDYE